MQEEPANPAANASSAGYDQGGVHNKLGQLTRQLHDALRELGYAQRLRSSADQLPDAQNRLSYIARLTGEAAEKVLTLVDDAKARQTTIVDQTKRMRQAMIADPVAAVAKGHIMNYLEEMEQSTEIVDQQLTDIMMAQDFHDLTGQVIAKVVHLAGNLENQLVELLLQTAPQGAVPAMPAAAAVSPPVPAAETDDVWAAALAESATAAGTTAAGASAAPGTHPDLHGPVVDPEGTPNVVTSQSEVDDLLASLGF
jgi:chemotaxis protein CheZ